MLRTPSTISRVTGPPCAAAWTASRNAYSGEVPISPNTTPILPSVRAQKPVVAGAASWASVDGTLRVMMPENALSVDVTRAGYRRLPGKLVNRSTLAPLSTGNLSANANSSRQNNGIIVGIIMASGPGAAADPHASSVMVTRRFADSVGSSGNNGWLSAFPETAKMWEDGTPSHSRIWRTALARSAERSNAPYSFRDGTKPAAVCPTIEMRSGVAFSGPANLLDQPPGAVIRRLGAVGEHRPAILVDDFQVEARHWFPQT